MSTVRKIKVCHFTSAHNWDDIRIFHKECVSLAKAGYDVSLVVANAPEQTVNGVKIVSADSVATSRLSRMITIAKQVYKKALEQDADVYHFHDPELLRFLPRLKRKGKKVIYDAHEDLPRQIAGKEYLKSKKTVGWAIEKFENYIARKADFVITATPFIAARFKTINPNSRDVNNYPLLSEIELQPASTSRDPRRICFIGNISGIRGLRELIIALEGTNIELDLGGKIPTDLRSELITLPGWKNVNELGYIDRQQSLDVKRNASVGVVTFLPLPNHINAQPNKIFEYMASELPVLGSDFPLWSSIIEANDCGLCVDPTNALAIRNGLLDLLSDPSQLKQMGQNGKSMVINKYNWDREEKVLIDIYESLF